ncbi:MAG: alpha-ketoglutarate-dependent dioxygenase AlkB [Gemmataceae bacterium]|nr:alpha-ketoglutarate-dependent dioxygenase AlkB [Gemmataceae bacterium]
MATLFPPTVTDEDIPAIPGLRYLPGYVTVPEEADLVRAIDAGGWNTEWRRRRQPYGASYRKGSSPLPMPGWGQRLADRLLADGITDVPFGQMLVNEYLPGQGIALHRDDEPFGRTVVSLSLLSPCVMDFRHRQSGVRMRLLLEARSLLVLEDEARYCWEHGIAARKKDRWHGLPLERRRRLSVTFRFLRDRRPP